MHAEWLLTTIRKHETWRSNFSVRLRTRRKVVEKKRISTLPAYARALFLRCFAVNVKQPIQPTCGTFFWFIQSLWKWSQFINESIDILRSRERELNWSAWWQNLGFAPHSEITSAEAVSCILVSVCLRPLWIRSNTAKWLCMSIGLPVGEHHQSIGVVLVRLKRLLEQVNFVSATLEVHVSPFPWLVKPQGRHLKPITCIELVILILDAFLGQFLWKHFEFSQN